MDKGIAQGGGEEDGTAIQTDKESKHSVHSLAIAPCMPSHTPTRFKRQRTWGGVVGQSLECTEPIRRLLTLICCMDGSGLRRLARACEYN